MAACVLIEDSETSNDKLIAGSPVDSHMLTEFCGTPAPQVVPQLSPPHLWGSIYTKRPWRVTEFGRPSGTGQLHLREAWGL